LLLNDFEYSLGKAYLESTPEGIGIGAHYLCNAKCVFCLGGKPAPFSLERYKDFFEPKLDSVISKARYVNFCGFGELLLMPDIERFIAYTEEKYPRVNKIYTTNGSPLINNKIAGSLTKAKSAVQVSLHASNSQLHGFLTKINTFDQITAGIKKLVSMRRDKGHPAVVLVFLINTLNIENLPIFVKFAADLGVDEVICNYLTAFHYSHLKFSCFFKQDITVENFKRAEELSEKLHMPVRLPPRFGVKSRVNKMHFCSDPWKYFYVENEGPVLPCCQAGYHTGYLNQTNFETLWNGGQYKYLRESLASGSPHEWCRYCHRYRSDNINDIRSHVCSRPDLREKILKGIKT
jgi:MoaA/NifB/PqqE/SkfB family radical SAM enzyme